MPSPPLSIVQSLSPRIAVLSSEDVTDSCEANGCRGLEELLRPWEGSTERVSILSSTLVPTIHPTFPLRFVSWAAIFGNPAAASPNPDIVADLISSLVASRRPDEEQHYPLTRSLVLSSRPLASHETFNHPVSVLFAVSTAEPDPVASLKRLQNTVLGAAQTVPWMDGGILMRFHVVVHDVSRAGEDLSGANELLASVKKVYGPHSTLLVINSQVEKRIPPPSPDVSTHPTIPLPRPFTPDEASPSALSQVYASALSSLTLSPMAAASASLADRAVSDTPYSPSKPARRKLYGAKLTAEDTQRLAALVRELVVQSLVPWMEGRVREWNEVYHSNRRGITGRLFGAGRKFFGSRPATPAPNSMQAGYNTVKGYYPTTTVEALTRRLADFAFMLRDYRFASTIYDSLRRDFAQDRAMRYSAAATEMYGLSLLLSHPYFLPSTPPSPPTVAFTTLQHTEISSWLEQAVLTYNGRGAEMQIQLDALRITVLYYEAWKMIGEWRGVGLALVRAAGEADEVPSAVMIEEAAAADVKGGKTKLGRRRRAFHLVMAARRYEKAGLKAYSRRCLDRASQIYRSAPWTAAQDRIEYSLGRQAYTLGESDIAVEHFLRLLRREDTGVMGSQGGPLQDMALAYEQLASHPQMLESAKDKLQLPTPVFDVRKTRVVASSSTASTSGTSGTSAQWADLESQALRSWDRKGKKPMSLLPAQDRVIASVGETFHVELIATNPLNAPLVLSDVTLVIEPEPDGYLEVQTISEVSLEAYESRAISVGIIANAPCQINITAAKFLFHRFLPCEQPLQRRGKRLHKSKEQRLNPTYAKDDSLVVSVEAARPAVRVEMLDWPETLYHGEQHAAVLRLENIGKGAVEDVRLFVTEPGMIRLRTDGDTQHDDTIASIPNDIETDDSTVLHQARLEAGSTIIIPITLTGMTPGRADLLGLIIFSSTDDTDDTAIATLALSVDVLPLLQIASSSRGTNGDGYLVSLDIANVSDLMVEVNAITAFSPYWTISSTPGPATTLHPNQVSRTPHHVTRQQVDAEPDLAQHLLVQALGQLLENQPDRIERVERAPIPPSHKRGVRPAAFAAFQDSRRRFRLSYLGSKFPTIPPDLLARMFPLFDPLDLDIIVRWSVPAGPGSSRRRDGRAFVHALRPAPEFAIVEPLRLQVEKALATGGKQTRTMYEETGRLRRVLVESVLEGCLAREEDPVGVRVRVEGAMRGVIVHDFGKGSCSIPVRFEIRNRSPMLPVRWVLRLPPPSPLPSTYEPASLSPPYFAGSLSHRGTLAPGSAFTSSASLWVHEPSFVSLTEWELEVETGEEGEAGWRARASWVRIGQDGVVEVAQA